MARLTRDGLSPDRGAVDSLQADLAVRSAHLRKQVAERGVGVITIVADSFVLTNDSGPRTVEVPIGEGVSYILAAPLRRARLVSTRPDSGVLAEVAWYLFTNEDPFDRAARMIKHLPPSAFRALPGAIARQLDSLGCVLPQSDLDSLPNNVIRGSFAARGQTDWAVICAQRGIASLLVFWGGPASCPAPLWRRGEREDVEEAGSGSRYLRKIGVADSARIAAISVGETGGEIQATLNEALSSRGHDGLEDMMEGKASSVMYCVHGKWMNLGGSD